MIHNEFLNPLIESGILNGYEYVLRKLIEAKIPDENKFEKCAFFLLEYEKFETMKDFKQVGLKDLINLKESEKIVDKKSAKEIIPNYPIKLFSEELYKKEENIPIKGKLLVEMPITELLNHHIQMETEKINEKELSNPNPDTHSFLKYSTSENQKLKNFIFKTEPNFKEFSFVPFMDTAVPDNDLHYQNTNPNAYSNHLNDSKGYYKDSPEIRNNPQNINDEYDRHSNHNNLRTQSYEESNSSRVATNPNLMKESKEFVNDLLGECGENYKTEHSIESKRSNNENNISVNSSQKKKINNTNSALNEESKKEENQEEEEEEDSKKEENQSLPKENQEEENEEESVEENKENSEDEM